MIEVALETSTREPSVAARADGRLVEARLDKDGAHASDLLPALERLLGELGARPRDIGRVAVGVGPGSYTGLRVGVATAQGLARGAGAPLVGVPSGEALAHAECADDEEVVRLLDARSGELYYARYAKRGGVLVVVDAARVASPEEVRDLLPAGARILGDAGCADAAGLDDAARSRVTTPVPAAAAVLELAATREPAAAPEQVLPLYLRPFAAKTRKR